MKKRIAKQKLSLEVTKVRELDAQKMKEVAGGSAGYDFCGSNYSAYCYNAYTGRCTTSK